MKSVVTVLRDTIVAEGVVVGRTFADRAPAGCTTPYVVVTDAIDLIPALKGDARTAMLERFVQVSVFQDSKAEDGTVPQRVFSALDGARLDLGEGGHIIVAVQSMPRIFEDSTHIVHHPLTLSVKHDPTAF